MPQAQTYQSEFTGLEMDARFTAVAEIAAQLQSLVSELAGYYTKSEVDQLLAAINGMDYVDVATLPTASADTLGKIYLVGPDGSGYYAYYFTSYDGSAYSWVGPLGTTQISLANYVTKAELDQKVGKRTFEVISGKYIKTDGSIGSSANGFYTLPIPVKAGEILTYSIIGNGCAILSLYGNGVYTPVVTAPNSNTDYVAQTYTAVSDGYVVFSGKPGTLVLSSSIPQSTILLENEENDEALMMLSIGLEVAENNKAVTPTGSVVSATGYNISKPFHLLAGTKVRVTTVGYVLAALSKYDQENDTYTPVLWYGNDAVSTRRTADIVIKDTGFYVISSSNIKANASVYLLSGAMPRQYDVEMVAGAYRSSDGELYYSTSSDFLKFFVSTKLLRIDSRAVIASIDGIESGETFYVAQYDEKFRLLGTVSNTIPSLYYKCKYLRFSVSRTQAYGYSERVIKVTINSVQPCHFTFNSHSADIQSRWVFSTFEVKNVPDVEQVTQDSASFVGETSRIYSVGYIVLPQNYSPDGNPCPVVICCHGTDQLRWGSYEMRYNSTYINFLVKCGYAVIGCYSQTSKYSSTNDMDVPSSIVMATYQGLWDYMTRMYNIDKTGAYVFGYSAGGAETVLLSQIKTIPVKCAASLAGTVDAVCNMRIIDNGAGAINAIFTRFGLTWESDLPSGLSSQGTMKPVNSDIKTYILANLDKIKPYNVLNFHSTLDYAAFQERFMEVDAETATLAADSTLTSLVAAASVNLNTPLKIWQAVDDVNVPIQLSRWYAQMVMRGGGICFLREFPSGCGAHYAVGNTEHSTLTPMTDYVTPYGETVNVPIAYAEMVEWFRKW